MNKQEQDKQVIENAPEGYISDLSFDITGRYFDKFGNLLNSKGVWANCDDTPQRPRSLSDIRELVALRDEVAELKKQLKPRLFWDASDTEISHDSIEELIHIKFEDGAKVGDEIEIQRGVILPNEIYVITKIDDDDYSCEYELKGGDV